MTCDVGTKMPVGTILRLGSECGLDESLCGDPNCVLYGYVALMLDEAASPSLAML